ncbi:FAD-dependent oxidoreductase [Streptomyces sp. ISL-98]|uniref:NAD(P)/FAD-dependent oxidoreductase n=1 Tax=Streptomyces sp. ISL-98 TaxID=2819192 RepID=UPI001BE8B06E|nr:FAD-dependent oxidoreductase [Streptomyces sp. ISL-98]MBT2511697.1 FAD-dependent oxidoreductase [Streptomyces sp. ISL-98]
MRTVAVVGASLAGLYAARALRAQGYDGRLVIIGDEIHRPYDRPPLSKEFLTGAMAEDQLALSDAEEESELDAEWLLGVRAQGLDTRGRTIRLDSGRTVSADGVVIATGATPRRLPGTAATPGTAGGAALRGVHTLRTLDDARALRAELTTGQPVQVVVVGGGFIGSEVASSCVALGHHVTVVEAAPLPLLPQLGDAMATICAALHADHGVELVTGTGVTALRGTDAVTGVLLDDGRLLPADVVVVGIGAVPGTRWLEGSALAVRDGVLCDDGGVTTLPQVVAVGDVARVGGSRAEHWTNATEQPAAAVRNLLAGRTVESARPLPYFWSDQYGVRIQFAGRRLPCCTVRITEGSADEGSFLAVYEREGITVGALALNRPRPFMHLRRQLARGRRTRAAAAAAAAV